MLRFSVTLICAIILFSFSLFGQDKTPKFSNEFLAIGVGARGMGMSNTQVSNVNDVSSAYWNPAGLMNIEAKYEAMLMHAEYFAGIAKFDYLSFATPIDSLNHLAISIIRFAIDDIPDTRFLYDASGRLNYDNIRFFSAADYAFLVSYARKLKILNGLKLGGSLKVIHRKVGDFANAWGYGFDFGGQMTAGKWAIGAVIRDATGTFNTWSHNTDELNNIFALTGNEIPKNSIEITLPRMIIGISRYFTYKQFGLLAAFDNDMTFDGRRNVVIKTNTVSIDPHLGLEFDYQRIVFLRFGVGQLQQTKDFDGSESWVFQPNFGLGVKLNNVFIDYALADIGNQSESPYSHIFSIKAAFNDKGN
ncbi:MAG: PorV/PorQ family protein [Bacteroidetes bacterium]|nr:PorV/PorQ family protein [Bacteroidota bacterium]MDA1119772.1 PorV/PorQ family protein [Bacteroidota bacterium]